MSRFWQTSLKQAVLLLFLLMLGSTQLTQAADERPSSKIDPILWSNVQNRATTEFIIVFGESADLSQANTFPTKAEKGQYVYDTLRAHADRTQAAVRAMLDSKNDDYQPFYISNKIYVPSGDAALLTSLAQRDEVAQLVPNRQYQLVEPFDGIETAGPRTIESNLTFIHADQVWDLGITGDGVVLAGNDTGMQWDHPALKNQYRGWDGVSADHNYNWWDATGRYPTAPGDGNGHGTHTSGTMVGDDGGENQIGVAPTARVVHCKNLTDDGFGSDADIIECFQWDLAPWDLSGNNPRPDLAPDAINNSWGGYGGNPVFMTEIDALQAAGILVEFSAGNAGPSCGTLGSPGDFPQVLTTGSVDHSGGTLPGTITYFSSRGASPFSAEPLPDIMAPGENIRSSFPGGQYGSISGTSMSGPHVTGLIGLMWSANPGLRGFIEETHAIIKQTAVPLTGQTGSNCGGDYTEGPNNDWGAGTIDALAAVNAAMLYGDPGQLTGTVTDSATNDPIPNVTVRATLGDDLVWKRRTDASGIYSLTVFSGTYTVEASLYGYFPTVVNDVEVVADETTTLDIALDPAPFYTVSGVVTDANSGLPLYAQISIDGYPGEPVWTDPLTGAYSIDLAAGVPYIFRVAAWVDGYVPVVEAVGALDGAISADFTLTVDTLLCAAPGYEAQYAWFEDFETDDGGFVAAGNNSSWQFGTPTSGPNAAHSGSNVWATNLAGAYNDNEISTITSPDIDLSAYSGQTIILSWWEWVQMESCCDYVTVEVSSSGGDFWSQYYQFTQDTATGWTKQQIILDASFAVPNFRVRFGLFSDGSITLPGYYVDDIGVGALSTPPALYSTDFETDGGFVASGGNSSWAWGVPTRGPGFANSGSNVWATNLNGNYNDLERSQIESPTIDLSAGTDSLLQLSWWQWLQSEANVDTVNIDVSNDDGATWTTLVGPMSGAFESGWTPFYTILDPSYAVSTFRIRFTLTTDDAVTYPGFYLDDLAISRFVESGPALACEPLSGGLVIGHVRDANTDAPINGARVSSDVMRTRSQATPNDPAVEDGLFILFAETGSQTISAEFPRYTPTSQTLTITDGETHALDLSFGAGLLSADPNPLTVTLPLGDSETVDLTISNDGAADLTYVLRERNGEFTPARRNATGQGNWLYRATEGVLLEANGGEMKLAFPSAYQWEPDVISADVSVLVYADDFIHTAPNTFVDQALQTLGLPYTAHYDADFDGFLNSLNGSTWDIVIFADDNWYPPESVLNALTGYVAAEGNLILHSWTVGFNPTAALWETLGVRWQADNYEPPVPIYWWQPDHPIFTRPQEVPQLLTPTGGIYGIYGQQVEPLDGAVALAGVTEVETPNQATLVLGNDGRTVFRGFSDGQHNADLDGDGLIDALELWINLLDGIQTNFQYDVAWLATDVVTGTLAANGTQIIQVTFDSDTAETTQPGTYDGSLRFGNDTPYGALTVPVQMTLLPPANWGKLTGTVTGLTRCDQPGSPLRGVSIMIDDLIELKTRGDGAFAYWLPDDSYSVTVSKEGYAPQTFVANIAAGGTQLKNIELRRLIPCGDATPDGLSMTLNQNEQRTVALDLSNDGAGDWTYSIFESPFELVQVDLRSAEIRHTDRYSAPITGVTSVQTQLLTTGEATALPRSGWFGGAENPGGAIRYASAQCAEEPNSFYVISGVDRFSGLSKAVWRYDATTNDWTSLLPIPTAVEAAAATCYRGRIYVLGGSGTDQFYIFDLATREWLLGAPLPRGTEGAVAAAWDGKIYLIGGDDDFFPASGVSAEVNIYDIASDTWGDMGPEMPFPVSNAGSVQAANYVYIAGGWNVNSPASNETATQRYDLLTDTWEVGAPLLVGRADFALAATDSALYALGGDADGNEFFEPTATATRLPLATWPTGAWTALGDPLPVPLQANNAGFCTTALFDGNSAEIWSVGGLDLTTIGGRALFREQAGERCPSVYADVSWLRVSDVSGVVSADGTKALAVTFNSRNLAPGSYSATLVVAGNDVQQWIPVTLIVTGEHRIYLPIIFKQP